MRSRNWKFISFQRPVIFLQLVNTSRVVLYDIAGSGSEISPVFLIDDIKRIQKTEEQFSVLLFTTKGLYTDFKQQDVINKRSGFSDITKLYLLDFFTNKLIQNNADYSDRLEYGISILKPLNLGIIQVEEYPTVSFRGMTNKEVWNTLNKNYNLNSVLLRELDHKIGDKDLVVPRYKIRTCKVLKINKDSKYVVCQLDEMVFRCRYFKDEDAIDIENAKNIRVAYYQIEDRIKDSIYISTV